jgi:hypothetical protein
VFQDIFLCNHKHIQSFVNSVLIIAKTLSLSPSLARAFSIEASYRERERERKKEKKRYTILTFFFLRGKKGVRMKKRREGKRLEKRRRKPWQKRRHKIIVFAVVLFLFLFRYCNEEEEHHRLEKISTEKRSIKKGSERV